MGTECDRVRGALWCAARVSIGLAAWLAGALRTWPLGDADEGAVAGGAAGGADAAATVAAAVCASCSPRRTEPSLAMLPSDPLVRWPYESLSSTRSIKTTPTGVFT